MGIQLFLNKFNYRDGTIYQGILQAPNSCVAAEKKALLFLLTFTGSCTEPKDIQDLCLCVGDVRNPPHNGGGFSSAVEPRGWAAPQPRLISSFSTLFSLIRFSAALSSEQRGAFLCHTLAFSPTTFLRRCKC